MIRITILLSLFFLACVSPSNNTSQIKVTEVIDGDTVKLSNGKLLRYIGIDTPEIRIKEGKEFIYAPQFFSLDAKKFNERLVEGKFVKIEFDVDKTDKYGRLLGYCYVDDIFVNARLIEEGFAVLYTRPPNVKYVDEFIKLQRQAREDKKGLWGAYETISHNEAHKHVNQIRTVKGKVLNTYDSGKTVFLNFGSDYKTDFTVVIFKDSLKYFQDKGINPLSFYRKKTIQVTGKIKEYNGPEIIVNTPGEIEIINE